MSSTHIQILSLSTAINDNNSHDIQLQEERQREWDENLSYRWQQKKKKNIEQMHWKNEEQKESKRNKTISLLAIGRCEHE